MFSIVRQFYDVNIFLLHCSKCGLLSILEHVLQITDMLMHKKIHRKVFSELCSPYSLIPSRPGLPETFSWCDPPEDFCIYTSQNKNVYCGYPSFHFVPGCNPLMGRGPAVCSTRGLNASVSDSCWSGPALRSSGRFRAPGRSMATDCLGQRLCDQMKISSLRHAHHVGSAFSSVTRHRSIP